VTQYHLLADIINAGVFAAFIVSLLFPLVGLPALKFWPHWRIGFWPWWKTGFGINVVSLEFVIAVALLPSFLHRIAGLSATTYAFLWLQAVSICLVPVVIIWRAVIIWHAQRDPAREAEVPPGGKEP
jgi:hypothetical protein